MKNYKKIINHLYLGDFNSQPTFCKYVISATNELFLQKTANLKLKNHNIYLTEDKTQLFLNLLDYPEIGNINTYSLKTGLKFIHKILKMQQDLYVHCIWGVNRSASVVFIYLVITKHLKADNFSDAWQQFKRLYGRANPNPAYWHYLNNQFPYSNLSGNWLK